MGAANDVEKSTSQSCGSVSLQSFARSCIEGFNSQPELAAALGCSVQALQTATSEYLESFLGESSGPRSSQRLRLEFCHECRCGLRLRSGRVREYLILCTKTTSRTRAYLVPLSTPCQAHILRG